MKRKATKSKGINVPLALAGAGVLSYAAYKYINRNSTSLPETDNGTTDSGNNSSTTSNQATTKSRAVTVTRNWIKEQFPLKKGMQGGYTGRVQWNLNKLGAKIAADGKFGTDTENALSRYGYSIVVDKATFEALNRKANPPVELTPYQKLAQKGYKPATEIEPAIALRNLITGPNKNNAFGYNGIKKILAVKNINTLQNIVRSYKFMYGSPLSSDLLGLQNARLRLNDVITRVQPLSGIIELPSGLITVNQTLVKGKPGTPYLTVKAGTYLGKKHSEGKGLTFFKDKKGQLLQVPTTDIKAL